MMLPFVSSSPTNSETNLEASFDRLMIELRRSTVRETLKSRVRPMRSPT